MSFKVLNKPDLLAGSGDCKTFRTPKTPNKKFPTKTKKIHGENQNNILDLELNKLVGDSPNKTPKKFTPAKITPRKRSQTMTDFVRENKKSMICRPKVVFDLEKESHIEAKKVVNLLKNYQEKNASRRVANILMLNAWRCRKEEINNYQEQIKVLKDQVNQFQLQTVFLKNLRDKESQRRTEASVEVIKIKKELQDIQEEYKKTKEEREAFEIVIRNLEITVQKLQNELQKSHEEFLTVQKDCLDYQNKLNREKEKRNNLQNEKQCLIEKVALMQNVTSQQQMNVDRLRDIAEDLENRLQEKIKCINMCQSSEEAAEKKLIESEVRAEKMEQDLKNYEKQEKKLKNEISCLHNRLLNLEEQNLNLKMDCSTMKATIDRTQDRLSKITNRPWWQTPLNAFIKVAYLTLPALPDEILEYRH